MKRDSFFFADGMLRKCLLFNNRGVGGFSPWEWTTIFCPPPREWSESFLDLETDYRKYDFFKITGDMGVV